MEETQNSTEVIQQLQSTKKSHLWIIILIIFLVIVLSSVGTYYFLSKNQNPVNLQIIPQNQDKNEINTLKQWVNCNDVRHVLKEDNKLFINCLGGVLIVDFATGKVINQITMTKGLGNLTTTNLIKKGNVLYIGTQDGFTIYNLETNEVKKISVKQGLVNGANIFLADDNNTIWIGTFDGLSSYDINTGSIVNYKQELADNSTAYEVQKVLVTAKAIYVLISANSYSPGSIARFDKVTHTWEKFGPSVFLDKIDQNSRIDFFKIVESNGKIFISDEGHGGLWVGEDSQHITWKRMNTINEKLLKTSSDLIYLIGQNNGKLLIMVNNNLYTYDQNTEDINQIDLFKNISTNIGSLFINQDKNILWFKNLQANNWLTAFDISTFSYSSINLLDRPEAFVALLAVIDGKPILGSGESLWRQEGNSSFSKIAKISDNPFLLFEGRTPSVFQPIPNTTNILLYEQLCGEGCSKPILGIYDYFKNKMIEIPFPEKFIKTSSGSYQAINYMGYDTVGNNFKFASGSENKTVALLNSMTFDWQMTTSSEIIDWSKLNDLINSCTKSYSFISNDNKFTQVACSSAVENESFIWSIEHSNPNSILWQFDKKTNQKKQLKFSVAKASYSPFSGFDNTTISMISYVDNKLWIGTNRGLVSYDPQDGSWKLFTVENGLVSNEVNNFIINNHMICVFTQGGLSIIPY